MRVLPPAAMVFGGALLVSVAVHVPVYAVLGILSSTVPEDRARRRARGILFEIADLGPEQLQEKREEPAEPELELPPPPPPRSLSPPRSPSQPLRRAPARAVEPSAEAVSAPEETVGDSKAEPAGIDAPAADTDAPAEKASAALLAVATQGGTAPVAAASGSAALGPASGKAGSRATDTSNTRSGNGWGKGRATGEYRLAIPLVRIEPRYPRQAARDGVQGWVRLRFDISPFGKVDNPVVIESQPPGVFERAVLRAVRDWKYRPMIQDGVAVRRKNVQIRLTFKLDEKSGKLER